MVTDVALRHRLHPKTCRVRWLTRSSLCTAYIGAQLTQGSLGHHPPRPLRASSHLPRHSNYFPHTAVGHWSCSLTLTSASISILATSSSVGGNRYHGNFFNRRIIILPPRRVYSPILLVTLKTQPGWKGRPYSVTLRAIAMSTICICDYHSQRYDPRLQQHPTCYRASPKQGSRFEVVHKRPSRTGTRKF